MSLIHTQPLLTQITPCVLLLINLDDIYVDHVTSAVVLGLSFAGRWYAPKIGVTRAPFTVSILCNI